MRHRCSRRGKLGRRSADNCNKRGRAQRARSVCTRSQWRARLCRSVAARGQAAQLGMVLRRRHLDAVHADDRQAGAEFFQLPSPGSFDSPPGSGVPVRGTNSVSRQSMSSSGRRAGCRVPPAPSRIAPSTVPVGPCSQARAARALKIWPPCRERTRGQHARWPSECRQEGEGGHAAVRAVAEHRNHRQGQAGRTRDSPQHK